METKEFTGDLEHYVKCKNFLQEQGYAVADAIHIGGNMFEFEEDFGKNGRLGCHNVYKILAWMEGEEIKFEKKKIGFVCND